MLCGVVTGSLMGLGLLKGRDVGGGDVIPAFDAAREFVEAFQEKFGNIECRSLIGYDLTSRAQRKIFAVRKVKETSCRSYLEWAIARLIPYLERGQA